MHIKHTHTAQFRINPAEFNNFLDKNGSLSDVVHGS